MSDDHCKDYAFNCPECNAISYGSYQWNGYHRMRSNCCMKPNKEWWYQFLLELHADGKITCKDMKTDNNLNVNSYDR